MTPGEGGRTQLSEILVFEKAFDDTAQDVADLALSSLEQCDGVGMQLVDADGLSTRFFTDARSSRFDALQEQLDEGPCVACLRTGELHDLEPITSDERWPSFAPPARRAGLIACLALPLVARGVLIGALNLYAWPVVGFPGWDRQTARNFAARASISLASARVYARTQVIIAELRARVAEPDDIVHQAHGVLMVTGNTNLEDAIGRLVELARSQDGTLEEAAQSVLDSVA
ncbi:MAG TPA: GAF and ANTAR domain-containing protein [Acidimicrobiia bacterium]|nr:GAF and ANTAR domain-containing protein [Acidimicrobiia bacterium]